jgi:hypothetical protein
MGGTVGVFLLICLELLIFVNINGYRYLIPLNKILKKKKAIKRKTKEKAGKRIDKN